MKPSDNFNNEEENSQQLQHENAEPPIDEAGPAPKKKKTKKPWSTRKKIIIFSCLGIVFLLLAGIAIYGYSIWVNPMGQFANVAAQQTKASETPAATSPVPTTTEEDYIPVPTPDEPEPPDPYEQLVSQADFGLLKDIVNIMLIGVDYAEEREKVSHYVEFCG